jgi:hypothetical protein
MKKAMKTVAMLLATAGMMNPSAGLRATETTPTEKTQNTSETKGILPIKERKGQGIEVNDQAGGLDFNKYKMFAQPNPIYFPQVRKWASQRREAQKRKRSRN